MMNLLKRAAETILWAAAYASSVMLILVSAVAYSDVGAFPMAMAAVLNLLAGHELLHATAEIFGFMRAAMEAGHAPEA